MRWLRRIAALVVAAYLALFGGIAAFIQFYDPPRDMPHDAVIVVLGAGQRPDGTAGHASLLRVAAAVDLYRDGIGTSIVMTGGRLHGERRTVGAAMAEAAVAQGVPRQAILVEGAALSTLQNALFTGDILGPAADGPIILVTQRFHLPRSWASFHWAGMHDLVLYPADTPAAHWDRGGLRAVWSESVKTPLNAARALAASAADLAGLPEDRYIRLLD